MKLKLDELWPWLLGLVALWLFFRRSSPMSNMVSQIHGTENTGMLTDAQKHQATMQFKIARQMRKAAEEQGKWNAISGAIGNIGGIAGAAGSIMGGAGGLLGSLFGGLGTGINNLFTGGSGVSQSPGGVVSPNAVGAGATPIAIGRPPGSFQQQQNFTLIPFGTTIP